VAAQFQLNHFERISVQLTGFSVQLPSN
jgi:hypothetical protein